MQILVVSAMAVGLVLSGCASSLAGDPMMETTETGGGGGGGDGSGGGGDGSGGGGDGSGGGNGDGMGGGGGTPDNPANCSTAATYSDLGAVMGGAALVIPQNDANPDGPKLLQIAADLNMDAKRDTFIVQLWDGYGAYTNGFTAGAVDLTGVEADLNDCGACVFMGGDIDPANNQAAQYLMTSAGSINITQVDATPGTGRLVGTISNVKMREIQFDAEGAQSDVAGGCQSEIASMTFDLPVQLPQP